MFAPPLYSCFTTLISTFIKYIGIIIKYISQIRLSVEIDVAQETISAYEQGKAVPTCENLVKIAKFLNTSTDYLLGLSDMKLPYNKITLDKLSEEELTILIKYRRLSFSEKVSYAVI